MIVSYAIMRHQLMDIEVVIKKTLVFAGLASFALAVFASVTFLTQELLSVLIPQARMVSLVVSVAVIVLGYEPLRNWLVNLTDRFLFQKKESMVTVLNRLSQSIVTVLDLNQVGERILSTLRETIRLESGAILLVDEKKERLRILDSFGVAPLLTSPLQKTGGRNEAELALDPLISYFQRNGQILNLEEERVKSTLPQGLIERLKSLNAVLSIPLIHQNQLIGLLALGKKKSDEEFTKEELDFFPTLSGQVSIALENAKLLNEIVVERTAKAEAEKQAERIHFTRTLKHETGNKLVAIETASINMNRLLREEFSALKKRIGGLLPETELRLYDELDALTQKYSADMEQAGQRIRMTIDSVVGALSADHTEKQVMDFRVPWETAKRNVQVDYAFRFIVEAEDGFKLYGNVALIERVFENLFTNSRDAMTDLNEKLVFLNASYREHEGRKITWFEYWDGGQGIPASLFENVFDEGFSTKPKPESPTSMEAGHGLGLYVCRKIVEEFHGGKIWLEKRAEGGSKFVFWLPFQGEETSDRK